MLASEVKIGMKVKVVKRENGHQFKIGEVITIEKIDAESSGDDVELSLKCSTDTNTWYLCEDEIEAA